MKGFGIEIKNNLLEPKHIEHMGVAVWLYMWLIDKMTSIDEDGVGKVLGGKPIKFEEVGEELGTSMRTYRRWLSILSKEGYVNTKQTPYGLILSVNKAYKRFGNRYAKNGTSDKTEIGQKRHISKPKMAHLITKNGTSNKTVQLDSTVDKTMDTASGAGNDIALFIDEFKAVNPSHSRLFGNKTQRASAERLIKKYGLEKMVAAVKYLATIKDRQFAPSITTPYEMEAKLGKLITFTLRDKQKSSKLITI